MKIIAAYFVDDRSVPVRDRCITHWVTVAEEVVEHRLFSARYDLTLSTLTIKRFRQISTTRWQQSWLPLLHEITNETSIGVAREYYGDKSHGSHVTSYYVLKKNRKFYSFWDKNCFSLRITLCGFLIEWTDCRYAEAAPSRNWQQDKVGRSQERRDWRMCESEI
jgi:hypothetical protein